MVLAFLGGLGVFLLGMLLLTDGLKALAGSAMRGVLTRWVRGPLSGLGWGALATAVVQSSSATTLATIGMVSAGLLTFSQSVGVVLGANLGTTSTGWIVSQLGFKISLGAIAPMVVFVGVVLRLLARGRYAPFANVGSAIAGFGLLFLGIDLLQHGMEGLATTLTDGDRVSMLPAFMLDGSIAGRLVLVLLGIVMTLATMSSSAAMAATLAALASGAIDLHVAAVLVIGQNIGTSPKAIAASIGASAAAKRTAVAHLLFNLLAAMGALLLMGPMLWVCQWLSRVLGGGDAPTALAAFHTLFNVMGVAVLLPFVRPFARLVERLIPERDPLHSRYLSPAVAEVGPVALEVARRALCSVLIDAMMLTLQRLSIEPLPPGARLRGAAGRATGRPARVLVQGRDALAQVRTFVHGLGKAEQGGTEVARQIALLHAADHLEDAIDALRSSQWPLPGVDLKDPRRELRDGLAAALDGRTSADAVDFGRAAALLGPVAEAMARAHAAGRRRALARTARGRIGPRDAAATIDSLGVLDSLAKDLVRATHYLTDPPPSLDAATLDEPRNEPPAPAP